MKGAVAWMARNKVAANLLMLIILFAGFISLVNIKQQTFPEASLDAIQVRVTYLGAAPEEIAQSINQRVEEQIEAVEGVKRVTSVAAENVGIVTAELKLGTDASRALDDIKAEVDRITTLPDGAEKPEVQELTSLSSVLQVAIYGDAPERSLKELAERIKDDLTATDEISFVQISGLRPYEISIEIDRATLESYGLSLPQVAAVVRRASLDLPGGRLETDSEEILLRTKGQNYTGRDFEEIVLLSRPDGSKILLGEVATVRDGFQDVDLVTRFNGERAAFIKIFRTADERALDIVDAAKAYIDTELTTTLPAGIEVGIWQDESRILASRLELLVRNGLIGLLLVIIALTLFLNTRLAFWTSAGILMSFVGVFGLMILLDVSVNVISLFGFILAIGIVVDDAIVVGENVAAEQEKDPANPMDAAVRGAKRVSRPVIFAVFTTVAAFTPLLLVPGPLGKLLGDIPKIVILVLLLSLVEVLFILPNHLGHRPRAHRSRLAQAIDRVQARVNRGLRRFVEGPLEKSVRFATRRYGVVAASAVALLVISIGFVRGGYIGFSFFPQIEGDVVTARLELQPGTPAARTLAVTDYLEQAAQDVAEELQGELDDDHPALLKNVFVSVGEQPSLQGGPGSAGSQGIFNSHVAEVSIELPEAETRDLASAVFETAWRERVGEITGAKTLTFSSQVIQLGNPIQAEMSATDPAVLEAAKEDFKQELRTFTGVFDVADDQDAGKQELQLDIKPEATTLGLSLADLAQQVQAAYFGAEALRVQRGRDEVRVYVRLPEEERDALGDVADYRIRTPAGGYVPLYEVASVETGAAPTAINRKNGRRIVTVTADVNTGQVSADAVIAQLEAEIVPGLQRVHPGLRVSFEGEQAEQADTMAALAIFFPLAMFVIYCLLAIPFGSYIQPIIIMAAIPFGLIGALVGHLLFGLDLGLLSMFGIVGLSGVVVNDSLVLVDFINEERDKGKPMSEAILIGAKARFRPILLTTITTFLGVLPLILERSVQAQFLVPMAVALGFGIVFATGIILILVPALTMWQFEASEWVKARFSRSANRTSFVTQDG
ncbi:MAG: efflux RND transporter permease subunit [Rhodothermales bacterium]|nr:efflux RND transporter permease subunit [Rhodothermales bacterium]MBO6780000.1 efflux RND transporter permease subunit [Rhodothermales bacterium]